MPTRRELIVVATGFALMPWSITDHANHMQNKFVPMLPDAQKINFKNIDYKAYLAIAIKKASEFIELHKFELILYTLIILALTVILAAGIPPTKELILFLVL